MTSFLDNIEPTPAPDPEPIVPNFRAGEDQPPGPFARASRAQRERVVKPAAPRKPVPPYKAGHVREAMLRMYGAFAFGVMPFKPAVAATIMSPTKEPTEDEPNPQTVAENCADAWEEAAKVYPWVRQMLEGGEKWAAIIGLIVAHAPIGAAMIQGTPVADAMESFLKRQTREASAE